MLHKKNQPHNLLQLFHAYTMTDQLKIKYMCKPLC